MRRRIIYGAAGVGIFVVGLLAGMITSGGLPVFASSNSGTPATTTATKGDYCQLYIQTLANDLKVTPSKLTQSNQAALDAVVNQMAADGKITAAQKSKLEKAITNIGSNPCAYLNKMIQHARQGKAAQVLGATRTKLIDAVAPALNLTPATLQADLKAGQTIPAIAKTQNVPIATVNTAYLNEVQALLAKAVSSGMLSQVQSTAISQQISTMVSAGHYPLLEKSGLSLASSSLMAPATGQ